MFVLALTLVSVILLELGVSSIRKSFWPTDSELFQELQKDKAIQKRLEESLKAEENGSQVSFPKEKMSNDEEGGNLRSRNF